MVKGFSPGMFGSICATPNCQWLKLALVDQTPANSPTNSSK